MPATILAPTTITRTGVVDTLAAANVLGNFYTNTGSNWLEVSNASISSINVIVGGYTDGITVVSLKVIAVGAGVRKKIGPFPSNPYSDASGYVQITYSDVTTVTVGVFTL